MHKGGGGRRGGGLVTHSELCKGFREQTTSFTKIIKVTRNVNHHKTALSIKNILI